MKNPSIDTPPRSHSVSPPLPLSATASAVSTLLQQELARQHPRTPSDSSVSSSPATSLIGFGANGQNILAQFFTPNIATDAKQIPSGPMVAAVPAGFDFELPITFDGLMGGSDGGVTYRSEGEEGGFAYEEAELNRLTFAQAMNSLDAELYLPEMQEYSGQQYEVNSAAGGTEERPGNEASIEQEVEKRAAESDDQEDDEIKAAEVRRQIHIYSEQKRRAQIKDGFEDLRQQLPNCGGNKKISKAALLSKAVFYVRQLKTSHFALAKELERVHAENEQLRRFQEQVLQKQALEKMYGIGAS